MDRLAKAEMRIHVLNTRLETMDRVLKNHQMLLHALTGGDKCIIINDSHVDILQVIEPHVTEPDDTEDNTRCTMDKEWCPDDTDWCAWHNDDDTCCMEQTLSTPKCVDDTEEDFCDNYLSCAQCHTGRTS